MATITEASDVFTVIVLFEIEPAHQQELIDTFTAEVDRWISDLPGFVSSPFHKSFDGTRVLNYAHTVGCTQLPVIPEPSWRSPVNSYNRPYQWETKADWERFVNYGESATPSERVAQVRHEGFGDNNTYEVEHVAEG